VLRKAQAKKPLKTDGKKKRRPMTARSENQKCKPLKIK